MTKQRFRYHLTKAVHCYHLFCSARRSVPRLANAALARYNHHRSECIKAIRELEHRHGLRHRPAHKLRPRTLPDSPKTTF